MKKIIGKVTKLLESKYGVKSKEIDEKLLEEVKKDKDFKVEETKDGVIIKELLVE